MNVWWCVWRCVVVVCGVLCWCGGVNVCVLVVDVFVCVLCLLVVLLGCVCDWVVVW